MKFNFFYRNWHSNKQESLSIVQKSQDIISIMMLEKNNNNKKMIDATIKIMSIITLVISHEDYIVEHIVYNFLKRHPKEMYA